jgi:hypothetical protein
MTKNLVVIRHAKRAGSETEDLAPEYVDFAKQLRANIEKAIGPIDVVIPSDCEWAQNTARAMGYDFNICFKNLSQSVENWKEVPWGTDFETVRKSYLLGGPTKELGDYHSNFYQWLAGGSVRGNNILAITHDTRIEAAVASLLGKADPLFFKRSLDYLEGIIFSANKDGFFSAQSLRNDNVREIQPMREGIR